MSGLDELLDLFDADPDWDSSDDDDPFKALEERSKAEAKASNTSAPSKVKAGDKKSVQGKDALSFEDVFGAPLPISGSSRIENRVSEDFNSGKSKSMPENSTKKPLLYNGVSLQRASTLTVQPQVPILVDPFSLTRLVKNSVLLNFASDCQSLETSLQERNTGMQQVGLSTLPKWYRSGGNKDKIHFWTSGVLARKPPGLRKSSKGNDYALWEIVDLKNVEQSWTVFLFGSSTTASTLGSTPVGTLVDFLNPSVLEDSAGSRIKLSINNSNQVRRIGEAKDFGYCQSKKKDGQPCTAIVNRFDCPVCIHHASGELRKASRKNKKNGFELKKGSSAATLIKNRIMTTDFGPVIPQPKTRPADRPNPVAQNKRMVRMELQDPSNVLKRNSPSLGNHASISFKKEVNPLQLPASLMKPVERKITTLDPLKTRHLTDKDRQILEALAGSSSTTNSEMPSVLSNPNAGAKNFLKYLNRSDGKGREEVKELFSSKTPEPEVGTKLTMTREALFSMQKALNYVKSNGPIAKTNPNKVPTGTKRNLNGEKLPLKLAVTAEEKELEKSAKAKEFEEIVAAKSSHAVLAENLQEQDYFEKLERKEAIENKMLNTFKIPTSAVMCRICKYVALGRSDLCKQEGHEIRVVKAIKRFFKCKQCGNRVISLSRLPDHPCKRCKNSNWIIAPAGVEKAGPTLPSETLAIRGDEEKFLGSSSGKLFLNLD